MLVSVFNGRNVVFTDDIKYTIYYRNFLPSSDLYLANFHSVGTIILSYFKIWAKPALFLFIIVLFSKQ